MVSVRSSWRGRTRAPRCVASGTREHARAIQTVPCSRHFATAKESDDGTSTVDVPDGAARSNPTISPWSMEARAFESLWFPEHTHIPASRGTPYPGGGDPPKEYWHTFDPFGALARRGRGDQDDQARDRHLLAHRARYDRDCQGDGNGGSALREGASSDPAAGGTSKRWRTTGRILKTRFKKLREQVLAIREI